MSVPDRAGGVLKGRSRVPVALQRAADLVLLALAAVAALYMIALMAAEPLLVVRSQKAAVDVLVVLGGAAVDRGSKAAALFREGVAPRVLVTGTGDCEEVRDVLSTGGVPLSQIDMECASGSTLENAHRSSPILARAKVRRAALVTSWFHSRRALATFKTIMPQIEWSSLPSERAGPIWEIAGLSEGSQVAREYIKILWYWAVHRVSGFGVSGHPSESAILTPAQGSQLASSSRPKRSQIE